MRTRRGLFASNASRYRRIVLPCSRPMAKASLWESDIERVGFSATAALFLGTRNLAFTAGGLSVVNIPAGSAVVGVL